MFGLRILREALSSLPAHRKARLKPGFSSLGTRRYFSGGPPLSSKLEGNVQARSALDGEPGHSIDRSHILVYSRPEAKRPMRNPIPRDLFPGALEMMILESLRRQPAHGYALVQHIQQRSNSLLQVEEGSLYPALQRLLKGKLVRAEWTLSSTNRRVRTYEITAPGLRHLEKEISSFERMFEGISLVLSPEKA